MHMQDSSGNLTILGQSMARLPVEPPLAAILLAGVELKCTQEAANVVSLISSDRVFISPANKCDPQFTVCMWFSNHKCSGGLWPQKS